jgi:hypothetical protein
MDCHLNLSRGGKVTVFATKRVGVVFCFTIVLIFLVLLKTDSIRAYLWRVQVNVQDYGFQKCKEKSFHFYDNHRFSICARQPTGGQHYLAYVYDSSDQIAKFQSRDPKWIKAMHKYVVLGMNGPKYNEKFSLYYFMNRDRFDAKKVGDHVYLLYFDQGSNEGNIIGLEY